MKHAQFNVMLLLQVFVFAFLDSCSSYSSLHECYGGTYTFTPQSTSSIYYKPKTTNDRTLVVIKGKSVNTRFEVSFWNTIKMKDLTEEDDGAIVFFDQHNSVQLKIMDCQDPASKKYGEVFSLRIPSSAEYLEFAQVIPLDFALKSVIIWNRTDSSPTKGKINRNYFEIYGINQQDSGYYKFRGSKNELVKWKRLKVEASHEYFEVMEGQYFHTQFPVEFSFSHFLFSSLSVNKEVTSEYMDPRMEVTKSYFSIFDVKSQDAGTYKFIDTEGNNPVNMQLHVTEAVPTWAYIVIVAVIVLVIFICCCCIKKCCCKKSKRNSTDSTATAAPTVHFHDSNQPAPSGVPLLPREPRHFIADATINNTADNNMDPPPSTQATVSGDTGPTSLFMTSTDSEPKFELKGSVFPSAPPLSSDMCIQDVYTSDKLNF
ncbi:uncharacterized protein LOC117377750 [Periophthalmus magnuspinnatus]|uniref:uncharacterized protein LOC117377750 n=1 Tax=Periophthalmus magnuspinnatus TaxID=409849 RepID=UPI00145B5699|nr:uncharacterized protein LOC117377750 [Periophthalmus magnuspinnatus]